ncbi:hypothetical protein LINGRAHAP2_LOCUS26368 [Linum grandiflorum]
MSTDLDSRPLIGAPINHRPTSSINADVVGAKNNNSASDQQPLAVIKNINEDPDCNTPVTEEFKIPEARCCPPPPKKPKRISTTVACKRKLLSEFSFFDMINREEVDSLFQSAEKRRRPTPIQL